MNGSCCMTDANGQEYPGAPAHDYDCPVGGYGSSSPDYVQDDDGGWGPSGIEYVDHGEESPYPEYVGISTPTTKRSQMPVVQNPPRAEALMEQLVWWVPPNWVDSMANFRRYGLSEVTFGWLIAVTEGHEGLDPYDRWRFFCGCCWRTIRSGNAGRQPTSGLSPLGSRQS